MANQVLVKFRTSAKSQSVAQVLADQDIDVNEGVGGINARLIRSRSKDTAALVSDLSTRTDVEYVEPDYVIHADATPNDPYFSLLWGVQKIGSPSAWDISTGSQSNVVGVVDTGIDYTHPDLSKNMWSAPAEFTVNVGGRLVNCGTGSHGFNALTFSCDPMDDVNHGTHVAGTIGAAGNNGVGVIGVNWSASLMGLKFLRPDPNNPDKSIGSSSDAINAIEFAIQAKSRFGAAANVRILNNSWGDYVFSQTLLDEINLANSNDMLFTAAAGNDGTNNDIIPFYPASYNAPNVIAVASTDDLDRLATNSNVGRNSVHLGAPGVRIFSTIRGGNYDYFNGTSMATPHVSGAAALILSRCPLKTADLKNIILNNVDADFALNGFTITGGRLNVNKAIRACINQPDFTVTALPLSQSTARGGNTSYNLGVASLGNFTGTVTFSVSGLPNGASASFVPPSITTSGSSSLVVSTSASTPEGTYQLTVTGDSGGIRHSVSVALTVASPDFIISAAPPLRTVVPGSGSDYTVSISPVGSFTGAVNLSVNGLPTGASAAFSPTSVTASGTSIMTVVTTTDTPLGIYQLNIVGAGGSLQHSVSVSLAVSPPDFTLSVTLPTQAVVRGGSTNYTATITPVRGFTGTVALSVSGLPGGSAAVFNPTTVIAAGTSTLNVTTSGSTPAGTYSLTITGTSGSLQHTASVSFSIRPPTEFTVTDLGVLPGGTESHAYGIDRSGGQVVGSSKTASGNIRAFLWRNFSGMTDLGTLPNMAHSKAYGVSNRQVRTGDVVFTYTAVVGASGNDPQERQLDALERNHAFLWTSSGGIRDLGTLPGGQISAAYGINSSGQVVGASDFPSPTFLYPHAFLWTESGGMTNLGALANGRWSIAYSINSFGQVAGASRTDFPGGLNHAFLWAAGSGMRDLGILPNGFDSFATGVNNSGAVVGTSASSAFLWTAGSGMTSLGNLYSTTYAYDINDSGRVVGVSFRVAANSHAFIYRNGVMVDLNDLIPVDSGWELLEARGISNDGQIVGSGIINT